MFKTADNLDPERWSGEFNNFIKEVLNKDETVRPTADQLLDHPFLKNAE